LSLHFLPEMFQRMWRMQEMKMRMKTVMEENKWQAEGAFWGEKLPSCI
jgi:hypothetical protein